MTDNEASKAAATAQEEIATPATGVQAQLTALLERIGAMQSLPGSPPWVSDTVIICQPPVARAQHNELNENPHKTWVVTGFAEPLSWCFEQLRDILASEFDYIDLDDVLRHLAENAIEFLSRTSAGELNFEPQARGKALLLFVVQCARRTMARQHSSVF